MQTNWIAAFLLIGFIVFITVRGDLPKYLAAITGSGATPIATTEGHTAPTITPQQLRDFIK